MIEDFESAGNPVIRRAGEHRRQGFQIQISGFTSGWKLDVLHGGQRNADEQVELKRPRAGQTP